MKKISNKLTKADSRKLLKIKSTIDIIFIVFIGSIVGIFIQPLWVAIAVAYMLTFVSFLKEAVDIQIEKLIARRKINEALSALLNRVSIQNDQTKTR